jgi:hypothetical protein
MALGQDGRHVWLGRHSDPEQHELDDISAKLDAQGMTAWLAVMRGNFWSAANAREILVVRRLTQQDGDPDAAVGMWREARSKTLSEAG